MKNLGDVPFFGEVGRNLFSADGSPAGSLFHGGPVPPHAAEDLVARGMGGEIAKVQLDSAAPAKAEADFTQGTPFYELLVDLNTAAYQSGDGVRVNIPGYGIVYRRFGSSPIGRLDLKAAGTFSNFFPGARLKAKFDYFNIKATAGYNLEGGTATPYPTAGYALARLLILQQPDADYQEPLDIPGQIFPPVDLTAGACVWDNTYANALSCVVGTYPAQTTANFIDVRGWKRVRVFCQASAAFNTVDVYPIVTSLGDPFTDGLNRYLPLENFTIGAEVTTQRDFVFHFDCEGYEMLGFYIDNPQGGTLAAGGTIKMLFSGIL